MKKWAPARTCVLSIKRGRYIMHAIDGSMVSNQCPSNKLDFALCAIENLQTDRGDELNKSMQKE